MLVHLSRMYNVLFGLLFATVREIGGYGDTLPIPLSVVGFDPFFAALDAAGEGGKAIQEGGRSERAAGRFRTARRGHRSGSRTWKRPIDS